MSEQFHSRFHAQRNLPGRSSSQHALRRIVSRSPARAALIESLENRVLLSTAGMPDPGFGQGGYLKGDTVLGVASDGSLIGHRNTDDLQLALFHPDGSYGSPYSGRTPFPQTNVQADGKYLVINGTSWTGGNTLTRHNPYSGPNSDVDVTFGNNGTVSDFTSGTGYPPGAFNPENVTVIGNQILVGGGLLIGDEFGDRNTAIVRLNSDGSIDHSFGNSGIARGSVNNNNDVKTYQMLVGPNGNFFVSGEEFDYPTVTEFTPAGAYVSSNHVHSSTDQVDGLGFSANNVYFLAGNSRWDILAAYDLNLNPDTGFGNNGQVDVLPPDHSAPTCPILTGAGRWSSIPMAGFSFQIPTATWTAAAVITSLPTCRTGA